jgi:hypothetical protein
MTSPELTFVKGVQSAISGLLTSTILPSIVDYYREHHHVESSVEELARFLQLPNDSTTTRATFSPTALVPPKIPTGSARRTTSRNQTETTEEIPADYTGCIYKYKKGDKRGQYCGEPRFPGLMYCKTCKNKKTVKKQLERAGTTTATAKSVPPLPTDRNTTPVLNVDPFGPEGCDLFIEPKLGFIIRQELQDNRTIVLAMAKYHDGSFSTLSTEEKEFAKNIPMAVFEDAEAERQALEKLEKLMRPPTSDDEAEEKISQTSTTTKITKEASKEKEEEVEKEEVEKEEVEKEEVEKEEVEKEEEEVKDSQVENSLTKDTRSKRNTTSRTSMNIPHTSIPSLANKSERPRSKIPPIPGIPKQIF